MEGLDNPVRPANLDEIGLWMISQPEVDSEVVCGEITVTAPHLPYLCLPTGYDPDERTDSITITLRTNGSDCQPVAPISGIVPQEAWRSTIDRHENINITVVIVVAEDGTTTDILDGERGAEL